MESMAVKRDVASAVKCSSCYAPLRIPSNRTEAPRTILVCEYCGTTTRFDEARNWADEVNRWLERRFGERGGEIMDGGADVTLRSYVFQRDIVDFLASRFLNTAKFLNPVLSSPDGTSPATLREEMEFGLELSEYLDSLALDATLPDHPEIQSLAGTPVDLQEANRQAFKLRALTYFARGLVGMHRAAELNLTGAMAPTSVREFENAELCFEGSVKSCREGGQSFPEDPFFQSFGLLALGSSRFARSIRFHSLGYAFDTPLAEAHRAFESVTKRGTVALDQARRSAVFADPSKTKLKAQVEARFARAASDNLNRVSRYWDEVQSFPEQVHGVSNSMRFIAVEFLKSKAFSFKVGLALLADAVAGVGLSLAAAVSPRSFFASLTSAGLVALGVVGVVGTVLAFLLKRERDRRDTLAGQYRELARRTANPLYGRISLLTGNSINVVGHYLTPWEMLHDFFTSQVLRLGWLFRQGVIPSLIEQLEAIPLVPSPFVRAAPPSIAEPRKDRPTEEYETLRGVISPYPQVRFPFVP